MKAQIKKHISINKFLDEIFSYRLLFIFASVAYLIFPFILKYNDNTSIDPLWGRIAVSSIIMLVFILSFLSQYIRKNIAYFGYSLSFILTAHYEYLMYINNMSAGYAIGYFTIALCVVVLFRSVASLVIYISFSLLGIFAVYLLLPNPITNPILFFSILITVQVITFFVLVSRIALIRNLKLKNSQLRSTNIHLYNAVEKVKFTNVQLEQQKKEIDTQRAIVEKQNFELKKLSKIVNKSDNAIMIFDKDKNLEWVNEGFTRLTGFTKNEYIDKNGKTLREISKNKHIENIINKCINEKKAIAYEATNHSKSGKCLWIHTTMTPIYDENGVLTNLVAIDSDITPIKEAEEKIKKNAKLKEIFLANTSHEIRTPLNAIIGFTNLLANTELSENQADFVQNIKTSGENLRFILNDFLDFSKIEANKLSISKKEFNLKKNIDNLVNTFLITTSEKNISLAYKIDKKIPKFLIGDSFRLNQILINLISNSVKFTKNNGKIDVNISIKNENTDNIDLNFAVKDTGIGIPKAQQKNIFNSFTQVEEWTTREYGGTGLGLYIVKKLIDLQNGEISIESEIGKGTTFIFSLNFQKCNDLSKKVVYKEKNIFNETLSNKIKILIVEDNETNRQLVIDTIQIWQKEIDIHVAEDGLIAIEKVKKNNYDLVLMDIQMPKLDGFETTKYIKEKLGLNIPIVAMTAHALNHETRKCLKAGMNDYISKPFDPEILFEKICKYTNQKKFVKQNKTKEIENKQSSSETNQLINLSLLNRIYHNDQQKINKILQMYLDTIPIEISTLKKYFEEKNWEQIKRTAHTLKPKMSYLGLKTLYETSKEIEINIENIKDSKELPIMLDNFTDTWEKADCIINDIINLNQ